MGVIFGIINALVAVWFYSAAASVKKNPVMWALIGAATFLVCKFLGYSIIGLIQGSSDQAALSELVDQGYKVSERSAFELSKETFDDQSTTLGILFEFFPLILALGVTSFIRAKFILGMSYIASLTHKTSLKMVQKKSKKAGSDVDDSTNEELSNIIQTLTGLWKKFTNKN